MNYINYFKHILYNPPIHHRSVTNDLPEEDSLLKRIALLAIPFLGLYRPIGATLSIGMGSVRVLTHFQKALSLEREQRWTLMAKEVVQTILAIVTLTSTLFNIRLGILATTSIDAVHGFGSTALHCYRREYTKAVEEALNTTANSFYIAFMFSGSLESILAFTLVQVLISFIQAREELTKGKLLEGGAKFIFGFVRLTQAYHYCQAIERRNSLLNLVKSKALFERATRGRAVRHLIEHPLQDLQGQTERKQVVLVDAQGNQHLFGAHFHGFGKQLVKGENLTLRTQIIDGKEVLELDFKVNHVFRQKIQKTIEELKSIDRIEMKDILELTQSRVTEINVAQGDFFSAHQDPFFPLVGSTHKVNLVGLGSLSIGANSEVPNLYDRVVVHLSPNATIYDLHELISFLDLEEALKLSTFEDLERLKLGHLYRIFFPREATPFERTEEFFNLPFDKLKEKMFQLSPGMEEVYKQYFHKMKPYEILPGRIRYQVSGLSQKAYALGARAFTAAITGAYTEEELFVRVASILKMGMLSSELRWENDFLTKDVGFSSDFSTGGADSIYTQMFTQKNVRDQMQIGDLFYASKVRLLIKLEALETGSYQYDDDLFGTRQTEGTDWLDSNYLDRPNILEFTDRMQQLDSSDLGGHEVMFKERLDPSFLQGVIVEDQKTHDAFLEYLRYCNLIQKDLQGRETVLNVPVEQFIRIGTQVTERLLV